MSATSTVVGLLAAVAVGFGISAGIDAYEKTKEAVGIPRGPALDPAFLCDADDIAAAQKVKSAMLLGLGLPH